MSELKLDVSKTADDVSTLFCAGDIDASTVEQLDNSISLLLETGIKNLIIDIHNVEYAASRALGVFIGAHKILTERGGCIVLIKPSPAVMTSLEILGFDDLFDITEDVASALKIINN